MQEIRQGGTGAWVRFMLMAFCVLFVSVIGAGTPMPVQAATQAVGDDTYFPFPEPGTGGRGSEGEWRALEARLQHVEAALAGQEADSEQRLLQWQQEVAALRTSIHAYIGTLESVQGSLKQKLEALGELSPEESPPLTQQRAQIRKQKEEVEGQLAGYRLLHLYSGELYAKLNEKRQEILTENFLSKGESSWVLLTRHSESLWHWPTAIANFVAVQSGIAALPAATLLNLLLLLIAAFVSGLVLRRRWTGLSRKGSVNVYRHSVTVMAALGHYAPYLLLAIAISFFSGLVLSANAGLMGYWAGLGLPLLVLGLALPHFLFRGNAFSPPLFDRLSASVGRRLGRGMKALALLLYLGISFALSQAPESLSESELLLLRDLFVLAIVATLWWCCIAVRRLLVEQGIRGVYGLVMVVLLSALTAELLGYRNIAYWSLRILLGSGLLLFATWLAMRLINEFFEGFRKGRWWWQKGLRHLMGYGSDESMPWLAWIKLLVFLALWGGGAYALLLMWGVSNETVERLSGYLLTGFEVGSLNIVPLRVLIAVLVFALLLALSGWLRRQMESRWLDGSHMDRGSREALVTISGYFVIAVALLVALGVAGVKFTNLAIIAGALSVGIGFGLQNIVNNFVSGLILLFERPVKTGDWIIVGSTEGYVKRISIRSTLIQTFDRADVIVPNSELISGQVTNWMLHDPTGRIRIPVGVAYGSDTEKVRDILLKIAAAHESVITDGSVSEPKVLFQGFGDSALNFELRAFIQNIDERLQVASDINFAIDKAFREEGVEIPFPQRDLHVRDWKGPEA